MRKVLDAARELTDDEIRRAATLSVHTFAGATADEWLEQADALREGEGGDESANEDADVSQKIADVLHALDEEVSVRANAEGENSPPNENPTALANLWVTLEGVRGKLDNVAIPLGIRLRLEDPDLTAAMEELSARISSHFEKFRLVAERRRRLKGR